MKVIGEGGYGCVIRPSLTCTKKTQKNINYKNAVSKILDKTHAIEEMHSYDLIRNVDPKHEYYLGVPQTCVPENTPENNKVIRTCRDKGLRADAYHSLIIMPNGGITLDELGKKMHSWKSVKQIKKMQSFWIDALRLVEGIELFLKNDIIQFDIKPHNIVYDELTNKSNYIDFGLMQSKKKIIAEATKNKFWWAEHNHFNYPMENIYLNKSVYFEKAKQHINVEKATYDFLDNIGNDGAHEYAKFPVFHLVSTFLKLNQSEMDALAKGHFKTIANFKETEEDYVAFLYKSLDTADIYGLGMSFRTVYNGCKHLLSSKNRQLILEICNGMMSEDLAERFDIYTLKLKYKNFLEQSGFLSNIINVKQSAKSLMTLRHFSRKSSTSRSRSRSRSKSRTKSK
jgi:serine/threonine protein kinase